MILEKLEAFSAADIFESQLLPVLVIDRSLRIRAANEAACRFLGFSEDELDEKPLIELSNKKDETTKKVEILFNNAEKRDSLTMNAEWKTAKGIPLLLQLNVWLTHDKKGALIHIQDYSDCKKKEEQINFLEAVIDTIRNIQIASAKEKSRKKMLEYFCSYLQRRRKYRAVWIVVFDNEGKVAEFAESGLGIFPLEEIIRDGEFSNCIREAMKSKGIILTEDTLSQCGQCSLASIFGNTTCMTTRLELVERFYGVINVHLSSNIATKNEQDLLQSVSKDVSLVLHSYEVEEIRKEAEMEKEKAQKMKSDFIALASHQLRTPLTTLREGINILLDELAGELNEEQRNFIRALKRNSDRIDNVVSSILTLQKIETGLLTFNCRQLNIEEILYNLEPAVSRKTLLNDIQVNYLIGDKSLSIYCDKSMLITALQTLLTRVIQFTEEKEVLVSVKEENNGIQISFSSSKSKLSIQDQVSYFQQSTLSYRLSHKSDLMMIDMAICHEIIKHHNGSITIDEDNNQGMTIKVFIPECK
jgi:PAS domain S-box-containing protein